jgi:hypothetical protein
LASCTPNRKQRVPVIWHLFIDGKDIFFILMVDIHFLTYIFNKFSEKNENSKKKMKTPKKCIFDIFASF